MRTLDKKMKVSRRGFLAGSGMTALGTVALASGAVLIDPKGAWGVELKALQPETMATVIQMARDIFPHDGFPTLFYVKAVQPYDDAAATDAAVKALFEEGVTDLDAKAREAHGRGYLEIAWEDDRVALLKEIEAGPLFTKMRGDLVVTLYNQPEVWGKLGYEGPSAPFGGYLYRGFDDIDWLG